MSYATKYRMGWSSTSGDMEVDIQPDGYTGSVLSLTAAEEPLAIEWGRQNNRDLSIPVLESVAHLAFKGDSVGEQVEEVLNAGPFEYRVVIRQGGSVIWQGFITANEWSNNPDRPLETIELEADDGLKLLTKLSVDESLSQIGAKNVWDLIRGALSRLHDLPYSVGMEWYPYRDGNQLGADAQPLEQLSLPDTYLADQLTERGTLEVDAGKINERLILEDLVERFGMRAFLSNGEWWLRQRTQIDPSAGTYKRWVWDGANDTFLSPSSYDATQTLPPKRRREKPRQGVPRLSSVSSTYQYDRLGNLVGNPGFEEGLSQWSETEPVYDFPGGTTVASDVAVIAHSTSDTGRKPTQSDGSALEISVPSTEKDTGNQADITDLPEATFSGLDVFDAGPRGGIQLDLEFGYPFSPGGNQNAQSGAYVELEVGGKYLKRGDLNARADAPESDTEEGTIPIDDPASAISEATQDGVVVVPEGATLPVLGAGASKIEVSAPVRVGDTVIRGETDGDIDQGADIRFWYWTTSQNQLQDENTGDGVSDFPVLVTDLPNMEEQTLRASQRTPAGDPVTGDLTVRLQLFIAPNEFETAVLYDNVSLQILQQGEIVDQTQFVASTGEVGESRSLTHRTGDGPSPQHELGLILQGKDKPTQDWQVGPYASGDPRSGQNLEELSALELLASQRRTVNRRQRRVELRGEDVWPHHVFDVDGDLYDVSYMRRVWAGVDYAEVELAQLRDDGRSGIEQTFRLESDRATTAPTSSPSGGGGVPGGGGGGVSTWDALSDKPTVLTPPGFSAGNFPSAEKLAADDIATALSHDPGLDSGIRTSVRDSATDDALVTEQAVREAVGANIEVQNNGGTVLSNADTINLQGGLTALNPSSGLAAVSVDSTVARTNQDETFQQALDVKGEFSVSGALLPVATFERTGSPPSLQPVVMELKGDTGPLFPIYRSIGRVSGEDDPVARWSMRNDYAGGGDAAQIDVRTDTGGSPWNRTNMFLRLWEGFDTQITPLALTHENNVGAGGETNPAYTFDAAGDIRAQGIFRGTELRDDSGYVEGLFGEGFVLKDDRDNTGRSYMELDDMRVRGQLRAHIFKKDIVRATNALLYVSDAAQTTEDVTTPSSTGSTFTLYVDTNVFQAGEEITFKDSSGGGITEVVGTVSSTNGSTTRGGQTVYELSVTLDFGTSATIPGGSTVVRTSGARMLLDASTNDAPVQTLWNQNGNRRGAIGNLDGQYGFTSQTFGAAFGDPNGEHITMEPSSGFRIRDGNGNNAAQLSGSTLSIGTSFSYDASTGTLTIGGTGANSLESQSGAQSKADAAESAAENYADSITGDIAGLDQIQDTTFIQNGLIDTGLLAADAVTADEIAAGAVTTDEITIDDTLTLQPGGSFFAGRGGTRFAFGDFPLSKKDKGKQNHDGLGAGAFASEGDFDSAQDSRTRTVSLDTTDPWAVVASADYSISLSGNAAATSTLEVVATVNGTQVGRNLTSAATGNGRLEVIADLDLSAYSGTVSVDIEVITRSEASTTDDPGFDSASADTGDLGNDSNDPTTNVISSTDFFGPDGTVWRAGGQVQVEVNGRGNSSSKTTGAGQIWLRDELSAQKVTDRSSDRRLKSDVQPIEDPMGIIQNMQGKTFTYRGERSGGLIAQDALGVYDAAVSEYEEDGTTYYALDQRAFMGPVVEGMKELDDRLSQLEHQLNA